MYLKRLTCHGFKSFADKTDFDFGRGVTGIVGPNGCGKSNVVDAIKWVLGDQSARSLRGQQMMDVIFNGSGTRKGSGMSQVDLLLDNSDRKLDIDTDEVIVSRRLFRSGESAYLINNEIVRLKDVREMFMDTGIGFGAYSIIEQGKVDVLLQANPIERRMIFEEAAGISRYKARKKEAQRKLERVGQNLLRIEDIVAEVEKRLRSIKYQAGKARNFQAYDRQLREKRATYSLAEYHRLSQRQKELSKNSAQLSDEVTALRTSISSAEAHTASQDTELLKLEGQVHQIEQQILTNASEITAHNERIDQSGQRIAELMTVRGRAQQRLAVERLRALGLQRQIESEQDGIETLQDQVQQANTRVDELTEQDRQMAHELADLQARMDEDKAGIIDLLRQTSQLRNQIQSFDQRRQQLQEEKDRLVTRQQCIQDELDQTLATKTQLDDEAQKITDLIKDQTHKLDQAKQESAQLNAHHTEINQQLSAAKEYRSGLLSRQQLLNDLEQQLEGVDAGVKELLKLKQADHTGQKFACVKGMVADMIAADVSNAKLIETAIGEYDQYLVVQDSQAFFKDAHLFDDFPGRVHAICLDRLPPFVNGRDFTQQEGFVAYAMDLVEFPPEAERLIRHLLGKTIIVRNFADALRLAQQNPPGYRYVTQSGQLLDPEGICQLGPAGGRAGLISRKSELRDIDNQIGQVDQRIETMSQRIQQTSSQMEHLERVQQELRTAIYEARTTEVENNALRTNNQNTIDRLQQEQPLVAGELQSIEMQIADACDRSSQTAESLSQLERANTECEQRIAKLSLQVEDAVRSRQKLADDLTEAKVQVGQLSQRRTMLTDRIRSLSAEQQTVPEAVNSSAREADDAQARITQTDRAILTAQSRLAELC
ncbi:MAG: chromosome segregation protein SMC, partial [Planctomycetota bacterium]